MVPESGPLESGARHEHRFRGVPDSGPPDVGQNLGRGGGTHPPKAALGTSTAFRGWVPPPRPPAGEGGTHPPKAALGTSTAFGGWVPLRRRILLLSI
jgi:hypothetical protein